MPRFKPGQKVEESAGYRYPGIILGCLEIYNVEADHPDFAGMVHIFSEHQLVERSDRIQLPPEEENPPLVGLMRLHPPPKREEL